VTQTIIEFLIKFLAWAAPFTLRKAYPPNRIADLIKVRISSDGEGIEFWNGELPKAKTWITITNLSPFSLELDRAFGSFSYGAELENFFYLQKEKILPASEKSIPIEASLTKEHADVIQRLMTSNPRPEVRFNAHILGRVHNFDLYRTLGTTHHRLVNFKAAG
jgi:hypothetical protein